MNQGKEISQVHLDYWPLTKITKFSPENNYGILKRYLQF